MSFTCAIIKPDAVEHGSTGYILWMAEIVGLKIRDLRFVHMDSGTASEFYAEHKGKPFYEKLVKFMSSGPCVAVALEKAGDAVGEWRTLMKRVRDLEASKEYSERNAVHGSDSNESAKRELDFFFFPPFPASEVASEG